MTPADVSVDSLQKPSVMKLKIKASKTDPYRIGVDIFIGKTENSLCPVSAMLIYLTKRGQKPGPLFLFEDGMPLTRARFVPAVKSALTSVRVDQTGYSGHSF